MTNLEIILVNSGNQSLTNLKNFSNVKIININPEQFNHGESRNLGIEESTGDYIIFVTDDAIPSSNDLFNYMCSTCSVDNKIAVATARQIPRIDSDLMSQFSLYEYYSFLELNEDRVISAPNFATLNSVDKRKIAQIDDVCSCYRKEIISRYRFKNIKYAEDLELGTRLVTDGYKIAQLYSKGVIHSHLRPPSYYVKRQFLETKILTPSLNYQLPNF